MALSFRFEEALVFAHQLHARQHRKGTEIPYVSHLLGVASLVMEYGGGEEEAIAALLHDAVEDQGGAETREEIRRRFGETVALIVDGCTDAHDTPKPPWKERKDAYIAHLPTASPSALRVSAADKLYNVRSILKDYREIGDRVWERFKGGQDGTLWYYRTLLGAYRQASLSKETASLVEELDRRVKELEQLASEAEIGTPAA